MHPTRINKMNHNREVMTPKLGMFVLLSQEKLSSGCRLYFQLVRKVKSEYTVVGRPFSPPCQRTGLPLSEDRFWKYIYRPISGRK